MGRPHFRALSAFTLCLAFAGAAPLTANAYTTDGLVLNFDAGNPRSLDPQNVGTWFDISPTAVEATLFGSVSHDNARQAIVFDGSGAYYDVDGDFRDFTRGMTLEFGVSFGEDADSFERIFDFGMGADTNGIIVGRNETTENVFLETWDDGVRLGRCVTTTNPLADDLFHHWYFILDDDLTCRIYRDNVLQDTTILYASDSRFFNGFPPNETRTSNYIARSAWNFDASFEGYISYIRIYTDDLTEAERDENFATASGEPAEGLASTGAASGFWAVLAAFALGTLGILLRRQKRPASATSATSAT